MVNRSSFRNLHFNNFKLITWLQIFILAITPNFIFYQEANATTVGAEGWSVTKRLVQGATTFYDGTKNIVLNGKNYAATGAAKITPAASQVSKMIVRVGAVVAVDLAIKALLGAVDYTMDPANNRVKYYVDPSGGSCASNGSTCPTSPYLYQCSTGNGNLYCSGTYSNPESACSKAYPIGQSNFVGTSKVVKLSPIDYDCFLYAQSGEAVASGRLVTLNNPAYDPKAPPAREERYLPYDSVSARIISDAAAEKPEGKAFVSSVADTALEEDEQKQIVPANDMIQQLTQSQAIPTSGTGTGTAVPAPTTGEPTTGDPAAATPPYDIKLNFPVFLPQVRNALYAPTTPAHLPKPSILLPSFHVSVS